MCFVPVAYEVVGVSGEVMVGWSHTGLDEQVEAAIGLTRLYLHKQSLTEVHLVGEIGDGVGEVAGVVKCDSGVKPSRSSDGTVCDLLGFKERLDFWSVTPDHAAHLQQELSTNCFTYDLGFFYNVGVSNVSIVDLLGEQ